MTLTNSELRRAVEQEVNAIAIGADRDTMPKNMGILIPSIDLQRAIDRIMQLFAQHIDKQVIEARTDELKRIELAQQDEDRWSLFCMDDTSDFGNYISQRTRELKDNLKDKGGM